MRHEASRSRVLLVTLAALAFSACGGGGGGGGDGPLNITTTTADDGVIGAAYSETVVASGGRGSRTFSISSGNLPDGLSMSAGGAITGTPIGPVGTSSFNVEVTDSAKTPATDTQALTIDIVEPLLIVTASVPNTSVGDAYAATIAAAGGTPPYSFIANDPLPSGILLAADGSLEGTVATDAITSSFEVEVTDSSSPAQSATQAYKIQVTLEVATAALADATGGVAYSDAFEVRGGLPPYDWTLVGGALPDGLTGPDPATGVVSGTPDALCAATSATLDVEVTDSDSPAFTASRAGIDLTVNPGPLVITTAALPNGQVNVAYSQRVLAAGGVPPYAFAVTNGSLPSQLSLNANSGRITGTPDTLETQAFQVTVTDACPNTATQPLSITISPASLGRNNSIATATLLPGDGVYQASISPSGHPNTVFDPDEDFYAISTTATSTIEIDIDAQVNGSPLDSVIEVVNAAGNVLNLCGAPAYSAECVHDDEVLGVELDSRLELRVNGATTFYIHVVDWASDARPDKLYDLIITGVN